MVRHGGEDRGAGTAKPGECDAGSHRPGAESLEPGVAEAGRCLHEGADGSVVLNPDERRCQTTGGHDLDDLERRRHVLEPHAAGIRGTGEAVEPGRGQAIEPIDRDDVGAIDLQRPWEEHAVADLLGERDRVGHHVTRGPMATRVTTPDAV